MTKTNLVLLEQIARSVARSRFRAAISDELESKSSAIIKRGLPRVPDPELDEVGPVDRKSVGVSLRCWKSCSCHRHISLDYLAPSRSRPRACASLRAIAR